VFGTFVTPGRNKGSGQLRCANLNLNKLESAQRLVQAVTQIVADLTAWHRLEVYRELYFQTPDGSLPTDPGWYFVCDRHPTPLYVGQADNLDSRLNSTNGSLDGFADSGRTSDPARNFIKRLRTTGYISAFCVAIVCEPHVLQSVGISGPLNKLDRGNIEKILGLFRHKVITPMLLTSGSLRAAGVA
jgi:hypothetical protein